MVHLDKKRSAVDDLLQPVDSGKIRDKLGYYPSFHSQLVASNLSYPVKQLFKNAVLYACLLEAFEGAYQLKYGAQNKEETPFISKVSKAVLIGAIIADSIAHSLKQQLHYPPQYLPPTTYGVVLAFAVGFSAYSAPSGHTYTCTAAATAYVIFPAFLSLAG